MNIAVTILQMMILDFVLFFVLWFTIRNGAIQAVHMYPKEIQERVIELGMTTEKKIIIRGKMLKCIGFISYMGTTLLMVLVWNHAKGFYDVFWQCLFLLEQMNLFDCFIIDELWVKHSKRWVIPGTEALSHNYIPVRQQIMKRIAVAVLFAVISVIVAGIAARW